MDRNTDIAEGAAATASLLCLVHCLALPLILFALPVAIATHVASERVHWIILATMAPLALVAFRAGYRRHGNMRPVLLGLTGIACLGLGIVPTPFANGDVALTVAGSILLLAGHAGNWRLRRRAA